MLTRSHPVHHTLPLGTTVLQVAVKKNRSFMLRFFWDIFLFRNAPSFTPELATALATALPFFSVYWFEWSYIALIFAAFSIFISDKFTLPTITTSKTGLAWGIIATAEYSYYINVGPEFEAPINTLVIFLGLAICYTLHRASSTRAHSLPLDVDRSDLLLSPSPFLHDSTDMTVTLSLPGALCGPSIRFDSFFRYALVRSIVDAGYLEGPLPPNTVEDVPRAESDPHIHTPKLCTTCLSDKTKATMHCSVSAMLSHMRQLVRFRERKIVG